MKSPKEPQGRNPAETQSERDAAWHEAYDKAYNEAIEDGYNLDYAVEIATILAKETLWDDENPVFVAYGMKDGEIVKEIIPLGKKQESQP